jgi:tyrosyl-tRNA synthetase
VELIRKINQKESFGLTTPLITLSSGAKMGKTESGAIWLDENLLSAYDYWQFWRNTSDSDVGKFLHYFTDIEVDQIKKIIGGEENINNLKILLANKATEILHGKKAAQDAELTAKETFEQKGIGKNLPEIIIKQSTFSKGINIIDLLSANKIMDSKSEARRAVKNNGIKINDIMTSDDKRIIVLDDFKENSCIKISHGKKKHFIIKLI